MSNTNSSVEDWLRSLGLIAYTEAFIDNGYDELDICKEIGDEDLDAIGVVNPRDRTDILNSVARLKQSGTAVYFVLEDGGGNYIPPQVQPRERHDKLKLKMLLHEKLLAQKISLADAPYTNPDGSQGSLETLAKILADSLYTYEEDVLNALDSLWERQAATAANNLDNDPEPVPQKMLQPKRSSKPLRTAPPLPDQSIQRHSSFPLPPLQQKRSFPISEGSKVSEDSSSPDTPRVNKTDARKSLEYLDVEQPSKNKKEKRRRRVQRNTNLSRSMDSLPSNQVNRPHLKESDPAKSKKQAKPSSSFRFFRTKKKSPSRNSESDSTSDVSHASVERRSSNDMNASEMTMGEEDRMALMILVKQGDLTVEEAVEQLEQFEAERRQKLQEQHKGVDSGDEKHAHKHKMKRGILRNTKRKHKTCNPSDSSELVACSITMSEEDRIQLMKDVRDGKIDVEHAVTRLISYEEQHSHGYVDKDGKAACFYAKHAKQGTKSPKTSLHRSTTGSIRRISGALSSVISTPNPGEPNAVFYTGDTEGVRQTQSSPDVASDSSAEPSPKGPHKPIRRKLKPSPLHGSNSSIDSAGKGESPGRLRAHSGCDTSSKNPAMLKQIREMLDKTRIESGEASSGDSKEASNEALRSVPLCNKHNKTPPPQPRKGSLPVAERQRTDIVPFASLSRLPQSTTKECTEVTKPALPPRKPSPRVEEIPTPPNRRPPKIPDRTPSMAVEEPENERVHSSGFPIPPPRGLLKKTLSEEISTADIQNLNCKPFDSHHRLSLSSQSSKDEEIGTDSEGHDPSVQKNEFPLGTSEGNESQKHSPKQAPIKPKRRPPPLPSRLSQESISSLSSQDSVSTGGTDVQTQTTPRGDEVSSLERLSNSGASSMERPNSKLNTCQDYDAATPKQTGAQPEHFESALYIRPKPAPKPNLKPKPKLPPKKPGQGLSKVSGHKPDDSCTNIHFSELRGSSTSVNSNEFTDGQMVTACSSPGRLDTSCDSVSKETHNNATNHDRNTLPPRSKQNIKAPVIPKRPSHSLLDLIERRLRIENINLAHQPYSDNKGRWYIPANLVNRYSEELRRSPSEIAKTMDKLRLAKLRSMQRDGEPCDVDNLDLTGEKQGDLSSVTDWLISLGLPMYIGSLQEVGYDDMSSMPNMEEKHFQYAGVVDPRHMRRLLASVASMPKEES